MAVKCPKCDRTFKLPLHLGRHMATIHGQKKNPTARPPGMAAGNGRRRRRGRRRGRMARAALGMAPMSAAPSQLDGMSQKELVTLRRQIDRELLSRLVGA